MGASSSTRRIVIEEDEKQGTFIVKVSDSVTKQIYGVNGPGDKVAKKPIEPIHEAVEDVPALKPVEPIRKAVEAAPAVKPVLPIQLLPAIALGSPPPPLTSPKAVAAATAAPESTAKAEKKPTPAAAAAAGVETEVKKPEDRVAPEAVASAEEPASAAGAAQEEKKRVEEMTPAPPPEASAAAAVDPVPPPKVPRSSLLQLLSPSPTPPTKPEAPVAKESPSVKKEAPAASLVVSDKALFEERERLYKQMGEVYRERDKALKSIEDFYREKMNALQNQSTKMHSATRQEFNKAVEEVEKKFLKHVEAPVCEDLQLKVLECYRVNKAYPLKCSEEVQAFSTAVDQARQNVILAKKG